MNTHKWIKIDRGFYGLTGTPYAVQADGYEPSKSVGAEGAHLTHDGRVHGGYEGFTGGEWAAIHYGEVEAWRDAGIDDGENLNWFPTMREARAYVERRAK